MRSLVVVAALATACSSLGPVTPVRPDSPYDLPVVSGASYLGVIFPAEQAEDTVKFLGLQASHYWTPTPDEIKKCEAQLRQALELGAQEPERLDRWSVGKPQRRAYVAREIGEILVHYSEYRRQYVGIVTTNGAKRIVLSSFPGHRGAGEDGFSDWRQRFVVVHDGGFWYWRIQYEPESGQYLDFDSNGYA